MRGKGITRSNAPACVGVDVWRAEHSDMLPGALGEPGAGVFLRGTAARLQLIQHHQVGERGQSSIILCVGANK